MTMKKMPFWGILLSSIISFSAKSEGSIFDLKGMTGGFSNPDMSTRKSHEMLSPSVGALFASLPFIHNIYLYGNKDDALKKLIDELYFKQTDGSISTTVSYTKIARYFTPQDIGFIVGQLWKTLQKPDLQALKMNIDNYLNIFVTKAQENIQQEINIGLVKSWQRIEETMLKMQDDIERQKNLLAEKLESLKPKFDSVNRLYKTFKTEYMAKKRAMKKNLNITEEEKKKAAIETQFVSLVSNLSSSALAFMNDVFEKNVLSKKDLKTEAEKKLGNVYQFVQTQLEQYDTKMTNPIKPVLVGIFVILPSIIDAISPIVQSIQELEGHLKSHKDHVSRIKKKTEIIGSPLKNEDFKTSVQNFGDLVARAVALEQQGTYPSGTTIATLLAFLWKKSLSFDNFMQYIDALAESLGDQEKAEFYTLKEPRQSYTRQEYEQLKKKDKTAIANLSLEDMVYVIRGYQIFDSVVPPHINMLNNVRYKGHDFPDCGETSVRNLINVLIYDNVRGIFDIDLLRQMGAIEAVIDYYIKYGSPSALIEAEQQSHDDWALVVSGIIDVLYASSDKYDIEAGISNMMRVINYLFPGVASFSQLTQRLQTINIELTAQGTGTIEGAAIQDINNDVTLTIKKAQSKPFDLIWQFEPGHFELKFPPLFQPKFAQKYREVLLTKEPSSLIDLYMLASFGATYEELQNHALLKNSKALLYLLPLYTNKQKISAAGFVASYGTGSYKYNEYEGILIEGLSHHISRNVKDLNKLFKVVGEKNKKLLDTIVTQQKDSAGIAAAIQKVIETGDQELYKTIIVLHNFKLLHGEDVVDVLKALLAVPTEQFEWTKQLVARLEHWAIDLKDVDHESCVDLIMSLLGANQNDDPAYIKFLEKLFNNEKLAQEVGTIAGHDALDLMLKLITYCSNAQKSVPLPAALLSMEQASSLIQAIVKWLPDAIVKTEPWMNILLILYFKTSLFETVVPSIHQLFSNALKNLLHDDVDAIYHNTGSDNPQQLTELFKYCMANPIRKDLENHELSVSIINKLKTLFVDHCNAPKVSAFISYSVPVLLGDLTQEQRESNVIITLLDLFSDRSPELGTGQANQAANALDCIKGLERFWFLINFVEHPLTEQQIHTPLGSMIIHTIHNWLNPANQQDQPYVELSSWLINHFVNEPMTREQEGTIIGKMVAHNLITTIHNILALRWHAWLLEALIKNPINEEQQKTLFGRALIEGLDPILLIPANGWNLTEPLCKNMLENMDKYEGNLRTFLINLIQKLLADDVFGQGLIFAKAAKNHYFEHPMTKAYEQTDIGELIINNIDKIFTIEDLDQIQIDIENFLLKQPWTSEQLETAFGNKALDRLSEWLDELYRQAMSPFKTATSKELRELYEKIIALDFQFNEQNIAVKKILVNKFIEWYEGAYGNQALQKTFINAVHNILELGQYEIQRNKDTYIIENTVLNHIGELAGPLLIGALDQNQEIFRKNYDILFQFLKTQDVTSILNQFLAKNTEFYTLFMQGLLRNLLDPRITSSDPEKKEFNEKIFKSFNNIASGPFKHFMESYEFLLAEKQVEAIQRLVFNPLPENPDQEEQRNCMVRFLDNWNLQYGFLRFIGGGLALDLLPGLIVTPVPKDSDHLTKRIIMALLFEDLPRSYEIIQYSGAHYVMGLLEALIVTPVPSTVDQQKRRVLILDILNNVRIDADFFKDLTQDDVRRLIKALLESQREEEPAKIAFVKNIYQLLIGPAYSSYLSAEEIEQLRVKFEAQ